MKTHYGLTDSVFSELTEEQGITIMDLLTTLPLFCPYDRDIPVTKISLLYYIDAEGDFTEGNAKHKKIARAVFQCLSAADQIEVLSYLQYHEDEPLLTEEQANGDKDNVHTSDW